MKADEGQHYDFGARAYDPRVGRFLSLDPDRDKYAALSPFLISADNPISFIDENGRGPSWYNSLVRFGKKIMGFCYYHKWVTVKENTYLRRIKSFEIEYEKAKQQELKRREDPNYIPKSDIEIWHEAHQKSPHPDVNSATIREPQWDLAIEIDEFKKSKPDDNYLEQGYKFVISAIYSFGEDPWKAVSGYDGAGNNVNGNERVGSFATSVPVAGALKVGTNLVKVTGKTIIARFLDFCKQIKTKPGKSNMESLWKKFKENEEILKQHNAIKINEDIVSPVSNEAANKINESKNKSSTQNSNSENSNSEKWGRLMLGFFFTLGALAKWILSGFEGHYSHYSKDSIGEFIIGIVFWVLLMGVLFSLLYLYEYFFK